MADIEVNRPMFCPGCGSKNAIDQKFCRSCGMNLEQTAASILDQYPAAGREALQKQEQMLEKLGTVAFGGLGVVVGLGILAFIYWIVVKMVLSGTQPLAGLGLIVFVIFAGLSLSYVIWREMLNDKRKKIETAGHIMPEPEPMRSLVDGADFEPVPSVTEDTTKSLKVTNRLD